LWILDVVKVLCVLIGVFFIVVASVGVLRLPDFYSRIHAPTKAATLGLFFLLIAMSIAIPEPSVVMKSVLAMLFIGATAPVGAHILARAAYRNGVPAQGLGNLDEYAAPVLRRKADPRGLEPEHAIDLDQQEIREG
jgi:multicomponent Na+:H+ antiporter subunit G